MQLTRLEIKGFKSFGDKITINFDEGITAVVGPNGCGKSNVIDGIRWVLGEQSTRMLRSEKMENVIFNGSKSRKPANLAEVSLSFDNTKNILPTEFSQVTITRKLYRTGESEYRLNDVQCRLKDITDLFLDTGIGADSYSIIELKMIDEIITNKEGSRRNLFEEASGISKYKLRKKQTFNRLKETEADLSRVEDLLFEIEKNLRSLENQAKKAERYYKLKDQYKVLSVMLASFRIVSFNQSLNKLEEQEQLQRTNKAGITTEIDTLEAALQKQKLDSLNNEKNLAVQQKATNNFIAKIRTHESEKKIRNEQLKYQKDKEGRLDDELTRDRNQQNHVLYNVKRLTEEKAHEDDILHALQTGVVDLKSEVDALRADQSAKRAELNELIGINNNLQNQIYKAEKDIEILKIQQQSLEQEGRRNMDDAAGKEAELTDFNRAIAELTHRTDTLNHEFESVVESEEKLQNDIKNTEIEITRLRDDIRHESRKLDAKQNEYTLTKSMVDSLEGFPESIRFLKKNTSWSKKAPLFSDILFCKEDYRVAIENYLEPLMNYYVVESYNEAIEAVNLLSNAAKGRAQFFILNSYILISNGAQHVNDRLIAALSVVEIDTKYKALVSNLLQNVYLTDDTAESDLNNADLVEDIVLLGKSGKFNKSKYTLSGGSIGLFEGKRIGRAKNLENLSADIKAIETDVNKATLSANNLQNQLTAYKNSTMADEIKQKQQALTRLDTELITVQTRREQYQSFIENSLTRKENIAEKITSINEELENAQPNAESLKTERSIHNELLLGKQQEYNDLNERLNTQYAVYNQENIRYHQQQSKVAGLLKDLDYRDSQFKNLISRIDQNTAELDKLKAVIAETVLQTDHTDDDLVKMYTQREEFEQGTHQAEQLYYTSRGDITKTENEITRLRRMKEQADLIENELKDRRNNLKLDLNALKERLSIEFNLDIEELFDASPPAGETETDLRERTEKLKKQLDDFGAINPMAIEAYNEMNERYQFINTQKKDLLEAKSSLLATIKEIDDTAQEKFMTAFTSVRENFITVFRSLFNEEDSCDLILTEPTQPLDSDIDIIAKPKGKRPLSINQLSGGEKTLTATAILFSLYLLKPAPFCIFDEVDAPLDDTNIDKFNNIIRKFSTGSQFIIVSHNKRTIASADVIYGVTMVEQGISRVVPVDLRQLAN